MVPALEAFVERVRFTVLAILGDSLAANKLMGELIWFMVPKVLLWQQRCEVHIGTLISARPFVAYDIMSGVQCFAKLMRNKVMWVMQMRF